MASERGIRMASGTDGPKPIDVGFLRVDGERAGYEVMMDRCSVDAIGSILLLSVVAYPQQVKGIGAALHNRSNKYAFRPRDVRLGKRQDFRWKGGELQFTTNWEAVNQYTTWRPEPAGYRRYTYPFDYGLVHAMFISKRPDFLAAVTDKGLWSAVSSSRYSTPVVEGWMPYIVRKLIERKRLTFLAGHRAPCGILSAVDADLDAIVEQGMKDGAFLSDFYSLPIGKRAKGSA